MDAKGNYTVAPHELHLTHAEITIPQFNPVTGEDNSQRQVQKFYPQQFAQMEKDNNFAGKKVRILHDGTLPVNEEALVLNLTPTAGNVSEVDAQTTKPLNQLFGAELNAEYYRYFSEPIPKDFLSEADVKAAIKEKVEFIEAEKKEAQQQNQPSGLQGTDVANKSAAEKNKGGKTV